MNRRGSGFNLQPKLVEELDGFRSFVLLYMGLAESHSTLRIAKSAAEPTRDT